MDSRSLRKFPYQYPVVIVGTRRYKPNNASQTDRLSVAHLNITNSTGTNTLNPFSLELDTLSRLTRQADLEPAASGYGSQHYCPEGIPVETAIFAVLGAAALSFGILFMAITMITGAKRKKRAASNNESIQNENHLHFSGMFSDVIYQGIVYQTSRENVVHK